MRNKVLEEFPDRQKQGRSHKNGWLPPQPPDLRQKPGSLKQRSFRVVSLHSPLPPLLPLMKWLNKFKARQDVFITTVVGLSAILPFLKGTSPKVGEEDFSRPQGETRLGP